MLFVKLLDMKYVDEVRSCDCFQMGYLTSVVEELTNHRRQDATATMPAWILGRYLERKVHMELRLPRAK